jgi:predicted nucleotidyltransferase
VKTVILVGSRAKDASHDHSDGDLAVEGDDHIERVGICIYRAA